MPGERAGRRGRVAGSVGRAPGACAGRGQPPRPQLCAGCEPPRSGPERHLLPAACLGLWAGASEEPLPAAQAGQFVNTVFIHRGVDTDMCRSPNLSALNFPRLAAVCPTCGDQEHPGAPHPPGPRCPSVPPTQVPFGSPGLAHETSTRSLHTPGGIPHPEPYAHPRRCLPSEAWRVLLEVTADEDGARLGAAPWQPQGGFPLPARGPSHGLRIAALRLQAGSCPQSRTGQSHLNHPLLEASLESDSVGKAGPQVLGNFTATNCRAGCVPQCERQAVHGSFLNK